MAISYQMSSYHLDVVDVIVNSYINRSYITNAAGLADGS